jgi:hypothetical protein
MQSFTPQTLDSDFFRVPPRIQLTRGMHFTGEVLCASEFCRMPCLHIIYPRSCTFQRMEGGITSLLVVPRGFTYVIVQVTLVSRLDLDPAFFGH